LFTRLSDANICSSSQQSLATDAAGNLYIADGYNNRIRRVAANGVISTVGTTNFTATFVAIDSSGDVLAADQTQVARLSNGAFIPYGTAAFITGIAADSAGNVYIANAQEPGIQGWQPDYRILKVLATPPVVTMAPAQLSFQGIAGGPATAPQMVNFTGLPGIQFTLSPLPSWLTAGPSARTVPASVPFIGNPAYLAPGTYTALVSVSAAGVTVSPPVIAVTFTVSSPMPALVAPNGGLSFTLAQGSASPPHWGPCSPTIAARRSKPAPSRSSSAAAKSPLASMPQAADTGRLRGFRLGLRTA